MGRRSARDIYEMAYRKTVRDAEAPDPYWWIGRRCCEILGPFLEATPEERRRAVDEYMRRYGKNTYGLSQKIGVSHSTVSKWLGDVAGLPPCELAALFCGLSCLPEDFGLPPHTPEEVAALLSANVRRPEADGAARGPEAARRAVDIAAIVAALEGVDAETLGHVRAIAERVGRVKGDDPKK